jgi:hypothetical protein
MQGEDKYNAASVLMPTRVKATEIVKNVNTRHTSASNMYIVECSHKIYCTELS